MYSMHNMFFYLFIIIQLYRYIRQEGSQESSINVQRGNVKADTEISYEFGVKKDGKGPSIMTGEKAHLPLQLQISYTTQDGAQNMKVYTRKLPVTRSRESAEKGTTMRRKVLFEQQIWQSRIDHRESV